jgi:hypothetical protein
MTRYRNLTPKQIREAQAAAAAKAIMDGFSNKETKTINYIWMPDKDGNLVKKDAAFIKKSFSTLSKSAQRILAEYVIAVQNRQPS